MNSEKIHRLQELITTAGTAADNLKGRANWDVSQGQNTYRVVANTHSEVQECIALVKDTLLILSELISYIKTEVR